MHKPEVTRINLSLPKELLKKVDTIAQEGYTSRSEIIRQALLIYLHPARSPKATLTVRETNDLLRMRKIRSNYRKTFSKYNPDNK